MIHFLKITIQQKSTDDWRAFLDWADSDTMTVFQLRGYGASPGAAADDAWCRYSEDRDYYIEDYWSWEESAQ
jgi:hypothetical protein